MGRLKTIPDDERPRERLLRAGPRALSDAEILAVLFGGDLECAETLVASSGGAAALAGSTVPELRHVDGIGFARACQLVAAVELGRRAVLPARPHRVRLDDADDAARLFADLRTLDVEEMHVASLDARQRVIARHLIARGTANVVHVPPRDVLRRVILDGATLALVAHNHPSGDPRPSSDDDRLTDRLAAAADLVGVRLLDHVIVARDGIFSCEHHGKGLWRRTRE